MRSGTESVKAALLDTNILTAYLTPNHPSHQFVIDEILALRHRGYQLWVAPQCLYELWAVLTRPIEANGFGRTPEGQIKLWSKFVLTSSFAKTPLASLTNGGGCASRIRLSASAPTTPASSPICAGTGLQSC